MPPKPNPGIYFQLSSVLKLLFSMWFLTSFVFYTYPGPYLNTISFLASLALILMVFCSYSLFSHRMFLQQIFSDHLNSGCILAHLMGCSRVLYIPYYSICNLISIAYLNLHLPDVSNKKRKFTLGFHLSILHM